MCEVKDDNVMIAAAATANVVNAIAIFFFMISYPYVCRAQLLRFDFVSVSFINTTFLQK